MSDRKDYYFRQKVTESELDAGFDGLEQADFNTIVDQALFGVNEELTVTEKAGTPDLSVDVSGPGSAYSKQGERIAIPSTQNVDVSLDDGSVSTAVASAGNEKIVSVYIVFDRLLSDPRLDGNSITVFFDRAESFDFSVIQGAEALAGTAVAPALDPNKILLADITLEFSQTQVLNADISYDRTEYLIAEQGETPIALTALNLPSAISQLLSIINTNQINAAIKDAVNTFTENNTFQKSLLLGKITSNAELALARIVEDLPEGGFGSSGIRTLFMTYGNPGATHRVRIYLRNSATFLGADLEGRTILGMEVVYNAVWDPTTRTWSKDDDTEHSMVRSFGFDGSGGWSNVHIRDAGAGTWDDEIDSGGWDSARGEEVNFFSVFGPTKTMYGIRPGFVLNTQTALGEGPSAVAEHKLYAENIPKAWASFEVANGVVQNFRGFNCDTPANPGTGTSVIGLTFKTAMGDGNYSVITGQDQTSGTVYGLVGSSKVSTSISFHNFDFQIGALANFPATTVKYNVAVFAQQPPVPAPV